MVTDNTIAIQLELQGNFAKDLEKSAEKWEQTLGKGAQDLKAAVADMGKRFGGHLMEYSKADKEERKNLPGGKGIPEKGAQVMSKMLMGEKGIGGMAKDMKGMAASQIPFGKALGKGGLIGGGMAAVGSILGIVKKAFGSSSILNTVAKSFWTIMGTMADIILMPMLPYMFKFLQWMMTSVMPWVLKVSEGVGALLKGNPGPLYEMFYKLLIDVVKEAVILIVKAIPHIIPFLAKMIVGILKGLGKGLLGIFGFHQGGIASYHSGGTVPGGPQSEQVALLQGGETVIPRMDTVKKSVFGWFSGTSKMIDKTKDRMSRWVDEDIRKEGGTGGFWQRWYDSMVGASILPETKKGVQGWFSETEEESKSLKDKIWGWISDNAVTNFFSDIWGSIAGALSDIWGGKYSEGHKKYEGEPGGKPTYKGIWGFLQWLKDQIPSWDWVKGKIGEGVGQIGDIGDWIGKKLSGLWGGRRGPGVTEWGSTNTTDKNQYHGIWGKVLSFYDKIPTWDQIKDKVAEIGGGLAEFGESVKIRLGCLWGEWEWQGGGLRGWIYDNVWAKIPMWEDNSETGTSGIKTHLSNIGTSFINVGQKIADWLLGEYSDDAGRREGGVWGHWRENGGGIRGWIYDNTIGRLPSMWDIHQTMGQLLDKVGLVNISDEVVNPDDSTQVGHIYTLKGMGQIASEIGGWIKGVWGSWGPPYSEDRPRGLRGFIYDNTIGWIKDRLVDLGKWLYEHTGGKESWLMSMTETPIFQDGYTSTEPEIIGYTKTYKMKGIGDILGGVGRWLKNMWGSWGPGEGNTEYTEDRPRGLRGWIYDNTVGRLKSLATSIGKWLWDKTSSYDSQEGWTSPIVTKTGYGDDATYGMKSIGDIIGAIGGWVRDTIGGWGPEGGGIIGWIYENTVQKLSNTLYDAKQKILELLPESLKTETGYWAEGPHGMDHEWVHTGWKFKSFGEILSSLGNSIKNTLLGWKDAIFSMFPSLPAFDWPDIWSWIVDLMVNLRGWAAQIIHQIMEKAGFVGDVIGWISETAFGWDAYNSAKEWANRYKKPIFGQGGMGSAYYGGDLSTISGSYKSQETGEWQWYTKSTGPGTWTTGNPIYGDYGQLIPGFQKGGIVPGPRGAPQLAMVHGGETIIPAGGTNNNQKTFNIQINSNLSAADIVKDIDLIDSLNTSAYSTVLG